MRLRNVLRCRFRPSEIVVELHYKPREVFAEIRVAAYRDLGLGDNHLGKIRAGLKAPWILDNDLNRSTRYAFDNQMLYLPWDEAEKPRASSKLNIRRLLADLDRVEDKDMAEEPLDYCKHIPLRSP